MKSQPFRRAAHGVIGLSLAFVFLTVYRTNSGAPSAMRATTPIAAPAATPAPTPTNERYNCGDRQEPEYISFKWTRRMPQGGWLGEVTYGSIVNKPIQVFDAKVDTQANNGTGSIDWAFQAQDGSFLCRMTVEPRLLRRKVSFASCRNNNWPQLACAVR